MKKIIIAACMALLGCGSVFAQQGKQAIGGNLSYGTEIESVGIGLKYQYNITDQIRIEPSMNYFFKNDGLSMFDINANIHYLFPIASNISLYPLAGFTYTNWHLDLGKAGDYDVSGSDGKFGVNLGGFCNFRLLICHRLVICKLLINFTSYNILWYFKHLHLYKDSRYFRKTLIHSHRIDLIKLL